MEEWVGEVIFLGSLAVALVLVLVYGVVKGKLGSIAVRLSMAFTSREEFEAELERCSRGPSYPPARRPGDLNETFGAIFGGAFAEYGPRVVSSDPWVVYFDHFLTEAEVREYEEIVFDMELIRSKVSIDDSILHKYVTKIPFVKRMRWRHAQRNSLIRQCDSRCTTAPIVKAVEDRASRICRVPLENFETVQPFTYKEGMFYKPHNDNGPHDHLLPYGPRIFTFLVYLTDVQVGGGTRFNKLNVSVPARKGAAVLFANTLDEEPMEIDTRTLHEGVMVLSGEKRGVNLWLRQYNYREFQAAQCVGGGLQHRLAYYGKAAVSDVDRTTPRRPPGQPQIKFSNHLRTAVQVFWLDADRKKEVHIKDLEPEESFVLNTHVGHEFRIRSGDARKLLKLQRVGKALNGQEVTIGKPDLPQSEAEL
uniref:Fe2OG dioxygenase domain-containing protein n=1 Tax=Alexandrium monilatum TaxID=311494 RepID=A0A7S4PWU1_9DINO